MENEKSTTKSEYTTLFTEDLYDCVCLCHAALAQDSPEDERYYINAILNMLWAYLSLDQKKRIDTYLANKEYFPPVKIITPDNTLVT